jgi:hypothetical protein
VRRHIAPVMPPECSRASRVGSRRLAASTTLDTPSAPRCTVLVSDGGGVGLLGLGWSCWDLLQSTLTPSLPSRLGLAVPLRPNRPRLSRHEVVRDDAPDRAACLRGERSA